MSLWLLLNQKKYLTLKILLKTVSFILLLQMTMKIQYNINVRMIKVMNKSTVQVESLFIDSICDLFYLNHIGNCFLF